MDWDDSWETRGWFLSLHHIAVFFFEVLWMEWRDSDRLMMLVFPAAVKWNEKKWGGWRVRSSIIRILCLLLSSVSPFGFAIKHQQQTSESLDWRGGWLVDWWRWRRNERQPPVYSSLSWGWRSLHQLISVSSISPTVRSIRRQITFIPLSLTRPSFPLHLNVPSRCPGNELLLIAKRQWSDW